MEKEAMLHRIVEDALFEIQLQQCGVTGTKALDTVLNHQIARDKQGMSDTEYAQYMEMRNQFHVFISGLVRN